MAGLPFEPFPDFGTGVLSTTAAWVSFIAICSGEVL